MKRASIPFLDTLFCMLLVFFLMIHPDETSSMPPPADWTLTMTWPEGPADIDIYIEMPDSRIAWFMQKDLGEVVIDHDDLGQVGDRSLYNSEVVKFRTPPKGCYYVSVHNFNGRGQNGTMDLDLRDHDGDQIGYARFPMPDHHVERPVWRLCIDSVMAVMPSSRVIRGRARKA